MNPWFRVKRYGYGVDLPIAWQGWLLMGGYTLAALLAGLWLPLWAFLGVMAVMTPLLLVVARRRSDAEWRWRDGSEP